MTFTTRAGSSTRYRSGGTTGRFGVVNLTECRRGTMRRNLQANPQIGRYLVSVILFVAMAATVAGQTGQKPKKFLDWPARHRGSGKLLHRRRPEGHRLRDGACLLRRLSAPPPCGARSPSNHDRSDVCPVPDSSQEVLRSDGPSSWCTDRATRERVWSRRRMVVKAGIPISCGRAFRATWSISRGAAAPASISP